MTGFIEVTTGRYLFEININQIRCIAKQQNSEDAIISFAGLDDDHDIRTKDSYEEVKEKIRKAQAGS